eukprot:SAG22_NODE_601_length_8666_cov_7.089413_4_plen_333_part_00
MASPLVTISGEPVSRLAIGGGSAESQRDPGMLKAARAAGVNFVYVSSGERSPEFDADLHELAAGPQRSSLFIAANARTSPRAVREDVGRALEELGVAVLDAVVVQYILPDEEDAKVEAALRVAGELKAEGLVRHVAASTHDFALAVKLSSSGLLDAIMLRYNMAHRTVEKEAFPSALQHAVPVLSFTSTRWNSLQGGHKKWAGPRPDIGDCIGFALSHPAVAHNISSIRTTEELKTALSSLKAIEELKEKGEYAPALEEWRAYGTLVHDDPDNLLEGLEAVEAARATYAAGGGSAAAAAWNFDVMGTEADPTRKTAVVRGEAHGDRGDAAKL